MENNVDFELESELLEDKRNDSQISRCYGLSEHQAVRYQNNKLVYASNINKEDGPFFCKMCLSDVVVRKCTEKVDHFAHKARQSPIIRQRDKSIHDKCRDEILAYLISSFPEGNWAAERPIKESKEKGYKKVIPDISGRIGNIPIAVEVQLSPYTINRIADKIIEYQKRTPKVAVLYIIPLYEDLGDEPFRPRLFEKYLHSLYYGRVYYWTPNGGQKLFPVHFSPAKRWIEESTYFDTDLREEVSRGGFWLTYKTLKKPHYGSPVDIAKDFESMFRKSFEPKNVKKSIPECTIYKDKFNEWWDKNEYKDIAKQFAIFKEKPKPEFIEEYDYFDDYDEDYFD